MKKIKDFLYSVYIKMYYIPILLHSYIYRKKVLLPTYKKLNVIKDCCNCVGEKQVILMVRNETTFCGGLSDRFRGIVSVYQECKRQGVNFRIHFETPNLIDYLEPNQYDWVIKDEDICYDTKRVYPCTILTYHPLNDKKQLKVQNRILCWFLKKDYEQIHIYTNMLSGDYEYSQLFHELFKPTKELQEQVESHMGILGGVKKYQAVVFRFRQLLGDFREGGETLPKNERDNYIQQCLTVVERIHQQLPSEKILVTSDSMTFLHKVSQLPYVYTIPGEVVHVGFTYDASKKTYMKSFVDYYVLSYAYKITLVRDKKMYHSGFAYRAAKLNEAQYLEVWM